MAQLGHSDFTISALARADLERNNGAPIVPAAITDFLQQLYQPPRASGYGAPSLTPRYEAIEAGKPRTSDSQSLEKPTANAAVPDRIADLSSLRRMYSFLSDNFDRFDTNHSGRIYVSDIDSRKVKSVDAVPTSRLLKDEFSGKETWLLFVQTTHESPWGKDYLTRDDLKLFKQQLDAFEDWRRKQKEALPELYDQANFLDTNWSQLSNSLGCVTHSTLNKALEGTTDAYKRAMLEKLNRSLDEIFDEAAGPSGDPLALVMRSLIPHFMGYWGFHEYLERRYRAGLAPDAATKDRDSVDRFNNLMSSDWWVRQQLK